MCPSSHGRADETPLEVIRAEMGRQHADASASFEAAGKPAADMADSIRASGRLIMLGMGASHWANRMVLAAYRETGVDARADVLSEALRMPVVDGTVLLTSQSGASGEIALWLDRHGGRGGTFGITLEGESRLARAVPCLIGVGGRERAFAATRSVMLSVAMHAAVLARLGADVSSLRDVWSVPGELDMPDKAVAMLGGCSAAVLASRGEFAPVMECAALTFMELARRPAIGLELGQLIHGPQEALGADTALVLARPGGADAAGVTRFAHQAAQWGVPTVMFDMGDGSVPDGVCVVRVGKASGLAGVSRLLPAVQSLAIAAAARRVDDFGAPRRSSKITDGEAA